MNVIKHSFISPYRHTTWKGGCFYFEHTKNVVSEPWGECSTLECPAPTLFWLVHWCKSDIDALCSKSWTIFNTTGHFLNSRKENGKTWYAGKDVHLTHVYVEGKLKIAQTECMNEDSRGEDGFIRRFKKAFQAFKLKMMNKILFMLF